MIVTGYQDHLEDRRILRLENIEGVVKVDKNIDEFVVKIKDKTYIDNVFNAIKNNKIAKFVVEEPTLNEIFVEKVGENYEK